jgi:hypothetical protein
MLRKLRRHLWRFAPTALLPDIRRDFFKFQLPGSPVYGLWGATVASAAIGLLVGLFQVQGVKFPTPLFFVLAVLLFAMVAGGVSLMVFEVWRVVRAYLEHRATSASWVESEPPGFLDYIPDGMTAVERFNVEVVKLGEDTQELGEKIVIHTKRFERLVDADPRAQQSEANRSAKSMERSAVYIEKRLALLEACVKDIDRNLRPWVASQHITSAEEFEMVEGARDATAGSRDATAESRQHTAVYRDTIQATEAQNAARTVRLASARLGKALSGVVNVLGRFEKSSANLVRELDKKLEEWSSQQ